MKANTTTALGRTAGRTEKTYRIVTEMGKLIFVRGRGTDEEEANIDALATVADELDSPAIRMEEVHPSVALLAWMMGGVFLDNQIEQIGGAAV